MSPTQPVPRLNLEREQAALREALACLDSFADTIHTNLDQADWVTRREILRTLDSLARLGWKKRRPRPSSIRSR